MAIQPAWLLAAALHLGAADSEDLGPIRDQVIPATAAMWQLIPWETDLAAARARASREDKLLFLWAMNGHPLGCT